jgi:DNA-binding NarL/FixJ family response regulator
MTKVTLYCVQPLLIAGFQAILKGLDGFEASICTNAAELLEHLAAERPQVILFEVTSDIELEQLRRVVSLDRNAAVILWLDDVSPEFASQAISLGVRGLLRRSLSIELQARCLRIVAGGDLWVEKSLSNKLLGTKRISLTPRERQLVVLVAQGLKNKEIAYQLGVTEGTVKVYLCRLFDKVGVSDRLELALFAMKNLFVNQTSEITTPILSPATGVDADGISKAFVPSFICVDRGQEFDGRR